jgi:hypothetical protein
MMWWSLLTLIDEALLADLVQRKTVQVDRAGEIDAPSRARLNRSKNHSRPPRNPIRRTDR